MNEDKLETINSIENNAALKIQKCYKNRLELIDKINNHMNSIYSNIYNIVNRVQENHELNILSQDRYDTCMTDIDKIYNNFIMYDYPFTIKNFYVNQPIKVVKNIVELHDSIEELCKKCGMLNCSDILRVLCGNSWYNNLSVEYYDTFKFYDNYFIPVTSRKLENISDTMNLLSDDPEILPFVRKYHGDYNLSLNETINGADLYFPIGNNAIIISGVFRKDPLNLARMTKMLNNKTNDVEKLCKSLKIPDIFKSGFIKQISLRDFSVLTDDDLKALVKTNYDELDRIKHQPISGMVKEFLFSSEEKQRRILTLLLLSDSDDQFLAHIIYDMISNQSDLLKAQPLAEEIYRSLHWSVQKMFRIVFKNLENKKQKRDGDISEEDIPYEQRIEILNVSNSVKNKAIEKLKEMKGSKESGAKAQQYLDGLLKIPFGTYKKEPILDFLNKFTIKLQEFMEECNEKVINYVANTDSTSYACKKIKEIIDVYEPEKITTENQIDLFMDKINNIFEAVYKIVDKEFNSVENNSPKINDRYDESTPNLSPRELKTAFTDNFDKLKKINDLRDSIYMDDSDEETLKRVEQSIEQNIEKSLQKELEILKEKVNIKKEELKTKLLDNDDDDNNIETEYNDEIVEIEETFIILYREWIDYKSKKKNYIKQIRNTLNNCVLGHKEAKSQIQRLVAQWMNGKMEGCVFGLRGPPGCGKCFRKDTPIMLSNGKIKMVQDITTEDKLMGDDSTPRNVLALGNGIEKMYRIEQVKGDDYVVNESHILSLKMTKGGKKGDKHQTILGKRYYKNDIVDICIKDYLKLPKYLKECLKGYKVGVEFPEKEVDLEPYALGYWLGDGTSTIPEITTAEHEVVDYFKEYVEKLGLELKQGNNTEHSKGEYRYTIKTKTKRNINKENIFYNYLKNLNLINNKHIPEVYKCNSRENRLKLLAGLIDSDGYYNPNNNSLEITQKNKTLSNDILFLVRSLGMRGMMKECKKSCIYKGEKKTGTYYRITITGAGLDEIPVLLERKKARPHKQIKNCLNTGIKLIPLEEDKYYGFQIDGNSRFLLGDFTVTHNTTIVREGLSKCLLDNNNNARPFASLPLGGSTNGAILEGHSYTYLGSTWGRIVDILMETKCMNPIIYIDEIDKISHTEHGREIIGILTHLTDSSQNTEFTDRYFAGIKLDLSKALIVFSYNDIERVDRILRDRITEIEVKPLTKTEKIKITKNYLLPNILEAVGYNEEDIVLSSELIEFIIEEYTYEAGVRKLKEKVFELIREMNLRRIIEEEPFPLPFNFTKEYIKEVFHKYPKVLITKIAKEPHIGIVNGLYATSAGTGGLTLVEVMKTPTDRKLGLELTGNQGDVMKESMSCAKTLAWNLLPKEIKKEIKDDWEETGNWGLHIHCPEAGMPKDGPSAGITITTAILSRLCGIPVKNTIAMTGEVDLHGKVHAIGGLNSKLEGARRAGVKLVLIPEDNREDYDKIVNEDALETPVSSPRTGNIKHSRFGEHFKVIPVKTIFEVIKYALIENEIDFINFCK